MQYQTFIEILGNVSVDTTNWRKFMTPAEARKSQHPVPIISLALHCTDRTTVGDYHRLIMLLDSVKTAMATDTPPLDVDEARRILSKTYEEEPTRRVLNYSLSPWCKDAGAKKSIQMFYGAITVLEKLGMH